MKKIVSVALCVLIVTSVAVINITASAAEEKSYKMGLVDFDAVLSGTDMKAKNYQKMEKYISDADKEMMILLFSLSIH